MKTLLKIAGFVVLGVAVIALLGLALGLAATLLKLLIPIAILGAIGFVAWKVFAGSGPSESAQESATQPEALPQAISGETAPATQKKSGVSEEEARRMFEQLRRPEQK